MQSLCRCRSELRELFTWGELASRCSHRCSNCQLNQASGGKFIINPKEDTRRFRGKTSVPVPAIIFLFYSASCSFPSLACKPSTGDNEANYLLLPRKFADTFADIFQVCVKHSNSPPGALFFPPHETTRSTGDVGRRRGKWRLGKRSRKNFCAENSSGIKMSLWLMHFLRTLLFYYGPGLTPTFPSRAFISSARLGSRVFADIFFSINNFDRWKFHISLRGRFVGGHNDDDGIDGGGGEGDIDGGRVQPEKAAQKFHIKSLLWNESSVSLRRLYCINRFFNSPAVQNWIFFLARSSRLSSINLRINFRTATSYDIPIYFLPPPTAFVENLMEYLQKKAHFHFHHLVLVFFPRASRGTFGESIWIHL